jgi:hypothetical protein
MSGVWRLDWPAAWSFSSQEKELCGEGCGGKRTGHRLESLAFRLRSIRIEAHRQCLDQGRTVGPLERIQPWVALSHFPAGQADPHRSIEPAGTFRQSGEEGLAQQQAFSAGCYRAEPQSASLVTLVQHNTPGIGWSLETIPVQDSSKLFAQRIDDEWRWHGSDQRWKGLPQRPGRGAVRPIGMQNMGQPTPAISQ